MRAVTLYSSLTLILLGAGTAGAEMPDFRLKLASQAAAASLAAAGPAPADKKKDKNAHDEEHGDHGEKGHGKGHGKHSSRLTDEEIPLQVEAVPDRPKPLLELGAPYLGTGNLPKGIQLPTGAVWQPQLLLFGTMRTAVQSFESDALPSGDARITEWTNRLDLFMNLQLSGTERLIAGIRALDTDGQFTSYFLEHPSGDLDGEFQDSFDADLEVLWFEGEVGEIFANLDTNDFKSFDVGFTVGRQPLFFQEGMLINDTLDGIGLTRNSLQPKATSNFRATFFYAWDNINIDNATRRSANLFAFLTSADFPKSTVDIDVAYVDAHPSDPFGDLVAGGISAVQRFGKTNSSFRLLASHAPDGETFAATDGFLLFSELSWTPPWGHDLVYLTSFYALDEYMPVARGIGGAGSGPLGRAGVNFAAVGLGSYGAPLSARARDVAGAAVGYQKFFAHNRRQLLTEFAGRYDTEGDDHSYAATLRFQAAVGRRLVVVVDGFAGYQNIDDRVPYGGRLELLLKF